MCLVINRNVTDKVLAEFQANKDEITAYKFVYKENEYSYRSFFWEMYWRSGTNTSNRLDPTLNSNELLLGEVRMGLHVSLDPNYFPNQILLPDDTPPLVRLEVRCKKEHFIAAGLWSDDQSLSAVFTEVTMIGEADVPANQPAP